MQAAECLALIEFMDNAAGEGCCFGELKAEVARITDGRIAFSNPKGWKWLSRWVVDQVLHAYSFILIVYSYLKSLGMSYMKCKKRQMVTIIKPVKVSSFYCACILTQNQVFSINRYFNNVHHVYHTNTGILIYNMDEACITNDDVDNGVWALDGTDIDKLSALSGPSGPINKQAFFQVW